MDFFSIPTLEKRKPAALLVLPFVKGKAKPAGLGRHGKGQKYAKEPIETKDFQGKEGELIVVYSSGEKEQRIALLGLGDPKTLDLEQLRRSYSALAEYCLSKKLGSINVVVPEMASFDEDTVIRGMAEGLLLSNYAFESLKHDTVKDQKTELIKKAFLIGGSSKGLHAAKQAAIISEAVSFARDLTNGNADDVTPQYLGQVAKGLAKKFKNVKATVFDKKRIEKENMGLLLAVNRGSSRDPAFIILEYKGDPKSKDNTAIVGKGITFDTGGLNIKMSNMETMRDDMSGAAVAFGTVMAAAHLGLKKNIVAVVPSTENSVGSKSYKPGDVYGSFSGKTVEIGNTDAEGRLVLADALAYTVAKLKPSRIVDFATLTGAMVICLGEEATGMMSNNDQLSSALSRAGEITYERVWRLPLFEEYKDQIKSDVADIKNTGGRQAGSITAGLFLEAFVGKTPWAHLDIAGTSFIPKKRRYHPKNGTGIGVRLMIEFLQNL